MPQTITQRLAASGFVALALSVAYLGYAGIASTQAPAQEEARPSVLSSNTELVALPVNVTDAHGVFVTGLTADNFSVFEDGQRQTVSFFEQEDTPVTVGLVVDHSGSMGPKLPEVAAAVLSFAHSSNPHDEMFVVDFDDD